MANSTPLTRRASVVRVQLVRERTLAYEATIGGPAALEAAARALIGDEDREVFLVLYLTTKHQIASLEAVARGTLNATLVHPREVFKGAILANAAAVALAHQHPSGDPTPSPEDLALTRQLMAAGEILGIRVIDHVVLGDTRFVSLRESTELWKEFSFHQ